MSKRKANIRPDLVGELFIDSGGNVYRLLRCDTEPLAYMKRIDGADIGLEKPLSFFANFVQLKPVRAIEKPLRQAQGKPKKPRADKGLKHQHRDPEPEEILDAGK